MIPPKRRLWILATVLLAACAPNSDGPLPPGRSGYEAAAELTLAQTAPEEHPGLLNVYRLGDDIISGSEPHGEEAFGALAEMGVRTILSVDGKVPDAEAAARHGMRYVHVPIQYSGIPAAERLRIAKTFRELPGPFYVHCFHGRHRGPAAAAWGRVTRDEIDRVRALAEMRQWCGTSKKYAGLYETIARSPAPGRPETDALRWDFPEAHRFEGFRQAMIGVSRTFDHLVALEKREWQADPEHPDVSAANEAAKLVDLFAECSRAEDVAKRPGDFKTALEESTAGSRALREGLEALSRGDREARARVDAAFVAVMERCDSCHGDYRND